MTGFEQLSKQLGVHIEPQLLELALTHSSYAYEQGNLPNNERLEFLGDSVLGFVVSGHIFNEFHESKINYQTETASKQEEIQNLKVKQSISMHLDKKYL
jgi:dsRNA-specific ribonuclease